MPPIARPCARIDRSLLWALKCRSGSHALSTVNHSRASSSTANDHASKVIFSGIQPTGVPHLGNYLGALKRWVQLQNDAVEDTKLIFSLVDLHAITIRQKPSQLRQWRKQSLAMLLAIGLDPKRSIIFNQSDVPAHSELMWILSCQASTGYLGRMTQWKDKTKGEKANSDKLRLGLFSYPVLQAADVLVHQTTHVPVGEDQAQHLEFARELAQSFNHKYGEGVLTLPETLISPVRRVFSLTEPGKKMSKSAPNPRSRILMTDSEEEIKTKIKFAVTDSLEGISYDPDNRPGVSNLIEIMYHSGPDAQDDVDNAGKKALAEDMAGLSFRAFKEKAGDAIDTIVRPIRERYAEAIANERVLDQIVAEGADRARSSAAMTMKQVKDAVGFV